MSAPYGFGTYHKNLRPWYLCNADDNWLSANSLEPSLDIYEHNGAEAGYKAARAARFEHGESGVGPDDESIARAVARGIEVALRELRPKR